jgi:hypothetical protein
MNIKKEQVKKVISAGFEPATVCVLDRRDNRLHQEILFCEEDHFFINIILILITDYINNLIPYLNLFDNQEFSQ